MSEDKEVKVVKVSKFPESGPQFDENAQELARQKGRDLLMNILVEMIDHPEQISVTYSVGDRTTVYHVDCHPKSLGQLIGAKGKNIGGIRAVVSAMMARKGIRAIVEIPYIEPRE